MTVQVFLINLDRSPERLAYMESQIDDFERIAGVDGLDNVPDWLAPEFPKNGPLTAGKIGCYASHMIAAQQIIGRGLPYALVIEDDVTLANDFIKCAQMAADAAPSGWDIVHLSSRYKRSVVHVAGLCGDRSLIRHTRLPVNTAAYLISNAGARKRLAPRQRVYPNDMDFRYAWRLGLDIYGVFPAPAVQDLAFASDIGPAPQHKTPGLIEQAYGAVWMARRLGLGTLLRGRKIDMTSRRGKVVCYGSA